MPNWGYLLTVCLLLEGIFLFYEAKEKVASVQCAHADLVKLYIRIQIDEDSFRRFYGNSELIQESAAMALRHRSRYRHQAASPLSWKFGSAKVLAITAKTVLITGMIAATLQIVALQSFQPERPVLVMALILWGVVPGGLASGDRRSSRRIYSSYAQSFQSPLWSERNSTLNPAEKALSLFSNFFSKNQAKDTQLAPSRGLASDVHSNAQTPAAIEVEQAESYSLVEWLDIVDKSSSSSTTVGARVPGAKSSERKEQTSP